MNKEILSEINRYREIVGLPILTEGKIPTTFFNDLVSNFAKKDVDDLAEAITKRNIPQMTDVFDDLARKYPKKTFEQLVEDFRLNRLTTAQEDSLIARFLKYGDDKVKQTVIKNFIDTNPSIKKIISTFVKNPDGSFKKLVDAGGNQTSVDDFVRALKAQGELDKYLADQNAIIDLSGFGKEMKDYLKQQLKNNVSDILSTPKSVKQIGIDDVYDTMKDIYKGKDFPSKESLKNLEDGLVTAGITKDELITKIVEKYGTNKESLVNQAKKWIGVGGEVGKAAQGLVEGSANTTKSILNKWTIGSIGLLAIIIGIYNYDNLRNFTRGERKDVWKDIYKETFYDLPEELQSKIAATYNTDQATTDSSKPNGIKSFDWDEGNEILIVSFFDGTKNTWKKMQTGEQQYWGVEGEIPKKYEGDEVLTSMTKAQAIEAIKKLGYVDPITLTPDTENQTSYTYVDGDGIDGTVELVDGKITVK
jgi:hypothetical protein